MTCSACGFENRAGARFCRECGAAQTMRCPACEAELPPDTKFCDECGASTTAPAPAVAARETRKVVTVVFADLAGSTSLQERMDPESARRVMERFYGLMTEAVTQHGGTVVKVMGDGVMAAFGVPEVAEDDAARAVRAAAAMHDAFGELGVSRVGLRVGVNTGEVVVSEGDADVVGDPVNVAARLEHAAALGEVLVGDTTWRLVRDVMTFEPVEPLTVKGKSEPVPAYRLLATATPTALTSTQFVGRARELDQLLDAFGQAVQTRKPQLAVVIGSPGLGKSRLAAELCTAVRGRGGAVLEAVCDPTAIAAYAPLVDVVAALQRDADDDRAVAIADSLLGKASPATPEETFWAVRRLLEIAATRQPTVLVIDDVHWAEPLLLDLVDHVIEWAVDAPLLVVALARPELREVRPMLAERSGTIVLGGLDDDASAALLGDLPTDLRERVLATAGGNPLFLRELLRMAAEDGADAVEVPPTIHALLAARIDRLTPNERAVVERASVVGHEFYRGAVAELARSSTTSVDGELETLRRKELVEPEGTYWIDEPVFRFHHALIRDAAYRRLLKEARAELHERFADWLQRKVGSLTGEHEEVIGYHLEQAHEYKRQLGSDDVALGRRAAEHLAAAAGRALTQDDLSAAATLSARALARLDDAEPLRARVLLDRCEALLATGEATQAVDAVAALRAAAIGDTRLGAWADCFACELRLLTESRDLTDVAATLAIAADALEGLGDAAGTAKAHAVRARVLARLGRVADSEAALDLALAAARQAGDRRCGNAVLSAAPVAALWGPSPVARASGRCLDVVRVLRITSGAPAVEATALRCQAVLEAIRERYDAARTLISQSRDLVAELGLAHALLETDLHDGIVELFAGEWSEAETALNRAYAGFVALGASSTAALAAVYLARALLETGRAEEAEALSVECERLSGEDLQVAVGWRSVRAVALARRGNADRAESLAREAVELAEPTDALVDQAHARRALAVVLRAAGRDRDADAEDVRADALLARKRGDADGGGMTTQAGAACTIQPEGSDFAVDVMRSYVVAMSTEDWDRVGRHYAVDFVMTDHRAALQSQMTGRDTFMAAARAIYAGRGLRWSVTILAAQYPAAVVHMRSASDEINRAYYVAGAINDEREFVELHQFEEDDMHAAFDEFDRLVAERSSLREVVGDVSGVRWIRATPVGLLYEHDGAFHVAELRGAITTYSLDEEFDAKLRLALGYRSPHSSRWLSDLFFDAHTARDWDHFVRVLSDDVEVEDRRAGHTWPTLHGPNEMLDRSRSGTTEMRDYFTASTEFLLLAADRGVVRSIVRGHDPSGGLIEVGRITVGFLGDQGIHRMVFFNAEDDHAALALAFGTSARGLLHAFVATHNAHDWVGFAQLMRDDFVLEDRRSLRSWADRLDRDAFVARAKSGVALAGDITAGIADWFVVRPDVVVARIMMRGTSHEAGVTGSADRLAVVFSDGERISRAVFFEPDDLAAATAVVETAHPVAALMERAFDSWRRGDWDAFRSGLAPDFVYEPRRGVFVIDAYDAEGLIANLQAQTGLGLKPQQSRVLATRGPDLALLSVLVTSDDGTGFEILQVVLLDASGGAALIVSFDADDEDAAFEELSARYRSTLAPAVQAVEDMHAATVDAYNRRDWERYRELLGPIGIMHDRRTLGLGSMPVAEWVAATSLLIEMVRAPVMRTIAVDAEDERGSVVRIRVTGEDGNGTPVEFRFRCVSVFEGGQAAAFEIFDDDAADAALARYRELTNRLLV